MSLSQRLSTSENLLGFRHSSLITTIRIEFSIASEARTGDVLVVIKNETSWCHIALVEGVTWVEKDQVNWRVVEYGASTSAANFNTQSDHHVHPFKTTKLVQGPNKALGVGYLHSEGTKFSYLFAAPNSPFPPAEIGRCGQMEI